MTQTKYFEKYTKLVDIRNKYSQAYRSHYETVFYIDDQFYRTLERLEEVYPTFFPKILKEIDRLTELDKVTVFALDENTSPTVRDDAVYHTLVDVCNKIKLDITNKSRGSDYGD